MEPKKTEKEKPNKKEPPPKQETEKTSKTVSPDLGFGKKIRR